MIDEAARRAFQAQIWDYYQRHGRHDLPWRQAENGFNPYHILVSEVMLQQTQVSRVLPKYRQFLERFSTPEALAAVPLGDVLRVWSGLGYNRRAKYLHQAAQQIVENYGGVFPRTVLELTGLPGIGQGTAGAILAYAFNEPVAFVETNIRTVFIHHFFHDQTGVADKAVLALVNQTLPEPGKSREWYWALMDYGSYLKKAEGNPNHRSRSYSKQSKFNGSRRQIRGQILRLLGGAPMSRRLLMHQVADERVGEVVDQLIAEGLVLKQGRSLSL